MWRRPYGALVGSVVMLLFEILWLPMFALLLAFARPAVAAIAVTAYLVCAAALAVRASMIGVYVSAHGVRVRRMLRTDTVAWADVTGIRTGGAVLGPFDLDREAIVVTVADGRVLRSPVQVGVSGSPWTRTGRLRSPIAAGQLLVGRRGFDGILRMLQERLARENPGTVPRPVPRPVVATSAADAAILARRRARGQPD